MYNNTVMCIYKGIIVIYCKINAKAVHIGVSTIVCWIDT